MSKTLKNYRREYTIWAAYRAAQAGSSKAKGIEFSSALKACGVIDYIDKYDKRDITQNEFNKLHSKWCNYIITYIKNEYSKSISYGIAAKLLGVFLKGYFILANNETTSLAKAIHPAIDSFLLKEIDEVKDTKLSKRYKWQKLEENDYYSLLNELCAFLDKDEPLWYLEKYWVLD